MICLVLGGIRAYAMEGEYPSSRNGPMEQDGPPTTPHVCDTFYRIVSQRCLGLALGTVRQISTTEFTAHGHSQFILLDELPAASAPLNNRSPQLREPHEQDQG